MQRMNLSLQVVAQLGPSQALIWGVREVWGFFMVLKPRKLFFSFPTFASGFCTAQAFPKKLDYPANMFAVFC